MTTANGTVLGPIGELGAHALIYAQAGFEVFPLNADKTPKTIHGMKDASRDAATVAAWWKQWPEALIGCRIPPELIVIDVDPKHSGMGTWKLLKDTYGRLPVTRTHQSGRNDGGGHLWFRRPPGKLSMRRLNQWAKENGVGEPAGKRSWVSGIDLLHHNHRYTVLPPSPHPATGAPYRWVEGRGLEVAAAEMPGWLAHMVTADPDPVVPAPRLTRSEADSIADWFSQTASWTDLLIPEGWTLVSGDGDKDGSEWRHPNATSPISATTRNGCLFVYSTNTDFEVTEEGAPHGYTRFRALAELAHGGDMSAAAREIRARRDGTPDRGFDWVGITDGVGGGNAPRIAPGAPESLQEAPEDRDGCIDWEGFWMLEHVEEDWLVEPVLPRGRQVALWATHKTGKSLLTLEIAAALATGAPVLGQAATALMEVVYLDFEMTEADLRDRLEDLGYGPESDLSRLHYYLLPSLPAFDTPAGAEALLGIVSRHRAEVLVIDTMSRVIAGEENSADTYRAFYRLVGLQLKHLGVTVIRLDHGGKNAEQGQRGSSAKGDDVDVIWELKQTDGGLELRSVSRMGWVPKVVSLRRKTDPLLAHALTEMPSWPAGTKELALILDRLGVPLDAGRRVARDALAGQGGANNELLGKALKYRRQRGLEDVV